MSFDPTIGLGSILSVLVLGAGIIGTWFTLKAKMDQLWKRSEKGEDQHDQNQARMAAIELQIARDCVKVDDFRRLEDRMTAKFEKVEHTIANSALKTVQAVKDVLRDILPPRGER